MKHFARGIHPQDHKEAACNQPIKEAPLPQKVILPLQQHLGCPTSPLVAIGDTVKEGQKIADTDKLLSAPIHASISGKVVQIEKLPNACNFDVLSIVIEGSGVAENKTTEKDRTLESLSSQEIKQCVREAGIVGLGGAAFPTHVKLDPPPGKEINTVIINGCECEPYLAGDYRLMLEQPEEIIFGACTIAKALNADKIIIGIEDNKPAAFAQMKAAQKKWKAASRTHHLENDFQEIAVVMLPTKYPQGGEKMLIKSLLNLEVPSGGLPHDIGIIVNNVGTTIAIAEAVKQAQPLIKRVVTVSGAGILQPQNLRVRIGTSFKEIIELAGGLSEDCTRIIMGGPLTGIAVSSLEVPVVKATNGILALTSKETKNFAEGPCIRCGRCIKACPMGLMPNFLCEFTKLKNWDKLSRYHVADCIECGSCAYVCPSRIYLVQYFKYAKLELRTRKAVCQ